MSRELILIPKVRYEQLLKQEQKPEKAVEQLSTNEKDLINKQDPTNSQLENTTVNQPIEQFKSETMHDVQQPQFQQTSEPKMIYSKKGTTKIAKIEKRHNGGYPYVTMPPKKMMNLQKRKDHLHSKIKWLSFHI